MAELTTWLAATAALAADMAPWAFAVAGVVAFHRYDLLYRAMAKRPAPAWVRFIGGGTDGRLLIVAIGVAAGATIWSLGLPVLTVALAITTVVVASVQWLRESGRGQ
jgi:hypothetical protein